MNEKLCEHGCGQPATHTTKGSLLSGPFGGRPVHQCAKSHNSCPAVKQRKIDASIKKYGTEFPWQTKEILEKRASTNVSRYGSACTIKNSEVAEKRKRTILEKYGVDSPSKDPSVKDKIRKGVETAYQVDLSYRYRIIETRRQKYGDDYSDIVEKNRRTQISSGRWIDPSMRSEWYRYKRNVRRLTRKNYLANKDYINPQDFPFGNALYHIDHIYSIKDGFKNGIPYQLIANKYNLRVVWHIDNKKKHTISEQTIQELVSKIIGA